MQGEDDLIEVGVAGSPFEEFLHEQGTHEETTAQAIKRVLAFQIAQATNGMVMASTLDDIMKDFSPERRARIEAEADRLQKEYRERHKASVENEPSSKS